MNGNTLRVLPRVRTYALALLVGLCTAAIGLLAGHYGLKSARTAAENRQLKGEVRDLVGRVVEVEQVLQEVGEERQAVDDLTLATLNGVIDTAAIDTEQNGRLYHALRSREASDDAAIRHLRQGPRVADAPYPALVARMATLKQEGRQLVTALRTTAKDLNHRSEILAAIPSRLPAKGWLSSEFGVRNSPFHGGESMHYGLDIAGEEGTPVYAPADGVVTYASVFGSFGKLVKIDHDFGISTRYAHNAQILVKKGAHVRRGDPIAVIGSTGRSTGPHVHYEILLHGKPVDPARFVLDRQLPAPAMATTSPHNFVMAIPNGTGGDAEPEETRAGDVMAIAADPDADANDNQKGLVPLLRGERLMMTANLPQPIGRLTTTDLYLLIAFLGISILALMIMRAPAEQALSSADAPTSSISLQPEALTSTGLPVELSWSHWTTRDMEDIDEE